MATPKKSEIRKEAKRLLYDAGKSKQETFRILNLSFNNLERVVDVLHYMPTQQQKEKYKTHQVVLIVLLLILAAVSLWNSNVSGGILTFSAMVYVVATQRVEYYFYITILMSIMVLAMAIGSIMANQTDWIVLVEFLIPCIGIVYLSYWLEEKMCPLPRVSKEEYFNSDGQKKTRINVLFAE